MPFKSKAQYRLFLQKEDSGELPKGTVAQWLSETPDMESLPERIGNKKMNKESSFALEQNDFIDNTFSMIMNEINPEMVKKADVLGTVSDLSFKFLPVAAFSLPFTLGGLYHMMNRELDNQRVAHKQRMHDLTVPFNDLYNDEEEEEE